MGEGEGKKVCIVFEGRDGAGKGGVIKAMTERVSPRTFASSRLPAPTEREKSQMYIQRYLPHLPAAGRNRDLRSQLVQPGRRRAGHGLYAPSGRCKQFLQMVPMLRKDDGGVGHHSSQILA